MISGSAAEINKIKAPLVVSLMTGTLQFEKNKKKFLCIIDTHILKPQIIYPENERKFTSTKLKENYIHSLKVRIYIIKVCLC